MAVGNAVLVVVIVVVIAVIYVMRMWHQRLALRLHSCYRMLNTKLKLLLYGQEIKRYPALAELMQWVFETQLKAKFAAIMESGRGPNN